MRFGWIEAFAPAAQGRRWACGLLLLPAVWLAKGATPVASGRAGHPAAPVGAPLAAEMPRALAGRPAAAVPTQGPGAASPPAAPGHRPPTRRPAR